MRFARISLSATVLLAFAMLPSITAGATEVPQTRTQMLVSTAWLEQHLHDRNLVVLCVGRSRSSYDVGHIPGARFLPVQDILEQRADSLNDLPPVATLQNVFETLGVGDDSTVVLYGEAGGMLAARAYFTLDYLGHGDRAALLDGGLEKWIAEGRPADRHPAVAQRARFTPNVQPEIVVSTARMHEIATGNPGRSLLLDARPPDEYSGAVMSEAVPKAGHIPGARSLYWKTLLESEQTPTLLDAERLHEEFQRAGAAPGKLVISYCRTGMQSSFDYFVAKYLGYETAMYDGSVYEWVHRGGFELAQDVAANKSPASTAHK